MKTFIKESSIIKSIFFVAIMFVMIYVKRGDFAGTYISNYNETEETETLELIKGSVSQAFTFSDDMKGIDFLIYNDSESVAKILAELIDVESGKVLFSENIDVPSSEAIQGVHFDAVLEKSEKQQYELRFTALDNCEKVLVPIIENDSLNTVTQSDRVISGNFRMSIITGYVRYWGALLGTLLLILVIAFILFGNFDRWGDKKNAIQVAMIALVAGMIFSCITPATQECDGWVHLSRSFDVSYGNVVNSITPINHGDGEIRIPENGDTVGYDVINPYSGSGNNFVKNLKDVTFTRNSKVIASTTGGGYASVFYYPQAFGLVIGRILNLSAYWSISLAHMMNLLVYVAIIYIALSIMPVYRNVMAVASLLPMTIFQSASCSPDALLVSISFLFIACCFYYAFKCERPLIWKDGLILGILLLLLMMCKVVYACIGLLVFMIPQKKFGNRKLYFKAFVVALIPLLLYGIKVLAAFFFPSSGSALGVDSTGQSMLQYVLANPLYGIKTILNTMITYTPQHINMLSILGNLNYVMDVLMYLTIGIFIIVVILDTNKYSAELGRKDRVLSLGAFGLTYLLILLGIFLGDYRMNPVGTPLIVGVQGRYFIPVLPLLAIIFGNKSVKHNINKFSEKIIAFMGVLLVITILLWMSKFYH